MCFMYILFTIFCYHTEYRNELYFTLCANAVRARNNPRKRTNKTILRY